MKKRGRKAAMELSIGTVVIIVLAMSMLVLGLILIKGIFSGATGAIRDIDKGVKDQIYKMFTDNDKKMVIYPSSRKIEIKQRTQGEGFAFSVRNVDIEDKDYVWKIYVDPQFDIQKKCKIRASEAEEWLITDRGSLTIGKGAIMEDPELATFNIPEDAPPCVIIYKIDINEKGGDFYTSNKIQLKINPR